MSTNTLINPLNSGYNNLTSSSDPVAQRIVNDFTIIYNNAVTIHNSNDVNTLDTSAVLIMNTYKDVINIATPCASISNTNKCSMPVCNWISDLERLYFDFLMLIYTMRELDTDPIKKNYQFIPFFMTNQFATMIYNNPNNLNEIDPPIYILCSGNNYSPPGGGSPSMTDLWNKLNKQMDIQQTAVIKRTETEDHFNFLLYILLPTAVTIIIILIYIKYAKNAKLEEMAIKQLQSKIN